MCGGRRRTDTPEGPPSNFTSVGAKANATLDFALPTGAQRQLNSFALTAARRHLPCAPVQLRLPMAGAGFGFDETRSACAIATLLRFSVALPEHSSSRIRRSNV